MLDATIRFALRQRLLIVAVSMALLAAGAWQSQQLEIDVFPNLNRPRVVVMTEAHGMAPEEVDSLITRPLEIAINGASGVQAVRSTSDVGLSVIQVEFDWGSDIYIARQLVDERLSTVAELLPDGIRPQLAPISSIMGQVLIIGMWSENGEIPPMELRTVADWQIRQQLLTVPGVAQVFTMGGGRKQFQVLVNPDRLREYGVTLHEVKEAVAESNENATGGYLDNQGDKELLVLSMGRVQTIEDLQKVVVTMRNERPVTLAEVAEVIEGPQVKRGDSSAFVRVSAEEFSGGPAVVLTINKQPGADTRAVTEQVLEKLEKISTTLKKDYPDLRIQPQIYSQRSFIDRAIENILEALRDGSLLVVIILYLFLLNFRTTFITLTAIPMSIAITVLVFSAFNLSINTMTLGGLAVAIGELVDDAIVDVENIFRRLRENRALEQPRNSLRVVYEASVEIRNSIVFGTIIVVLVFLPLFALSGIEGRLFAPLGVAYIVSILSSLAVSLTLTPVLSYWLLTRRGLWYALLTVLSLSGAGAAVAWWMPTAGWLTWTAFTLLGAAVLWTVVWFLDRAFADRHDDGFLVQGLKWLSGLAIRSSIRMSWVVLGVATLVVLIAAAFLYTRQRDFLPPFNEGTVQLNVAMAPGVSLRKSNETARTVEETLRQIPDIVAFARRTGRAELDEHAEGVNKSEFIIDIDPNSTKSRSEIEEEIRHAMEDIPSVNTSVEQPISHLISHMLTGVKAQIGIKLYGEDLTRLRNTAEQMKEAIQDVPGVTDLVLEPQAVIPQLQIDLDRDALARYGLTPAYVNEYVTTAMNGEVVSQVLLQQQTFDLIVRMDDAFREDRQTLARLAIELPGGGQTSLASLVKNPDQPFRVANGPNVIMRESAKKRIVLQCNVENRGAVNVVADIKERLQPIEDALPAGYTIEIGGQFESQESASRVIGLLFCVALVGVFLTLFTMFRSVSFALQVLAALPMAFIGSVAALVLTDQKLTVAALVGFISLAGIASRNGILLLNHYLHLVRYEGETWTREMIVRAGQERVAPVLMTALTSGIGLIPLALAAGEPGKEILYPVATVIIGGLISSTILEFFVRPALFWEFGRSAGEKILRNKEEHSALSNAEHVPPSLAATSTTAGSTLVGPEFATNGGQPGVEQH